jgi:4'-phosphopantetheinyl transferase
MIGQTIDIWKIDLDCDAALVGRLQATLSPDERVRAERLRFAHLRRRFTVARGALRAILGAALAAPPEAVPLRVGRNGKPEVDGGLCFNLSHSNDLAILAVTRGIELGVDVELVRPFAEVRQIVGQFFSANERMALSALPDGEWSEGFFNCWTRKEAYLKALGDGFARALDSFDVSLAPGEPPRLLRVAWDVREVDRWRMYAWAPAPGYTAALCAEGANWGVAHHRWG